MSKKEKPASQTGRQEEEKKSNNTFYIAMAVVLIFAVGGGFLYGKWNRTSASKQTVGKVERGGRLVQRSRRRCFLARHQMHIKWLRRYPRCLTAFLLLLL